MSGDGLQTGPAPQSLYHFSDSDGAPQVRASGLSRPTTIIAVCNIALLFRCPGCIYFSRNTYGYKRQVMATKGKKVDAVAYIRTSSAANVGHGKDSPVRQRRAIEAFAKRVGFVVV